MEKWGGGVIKVRYGGFENRIFSTGDFLITQRMFVTTFLVQCCLVLSSHSQWNLQRAKKLILKDYIASEGKQDYSYVSRLLYFRLTKIKHLTTFQSLKYAGCLRVYAHYYRTAKSVGEQTMPLSYMQTDATIPNIVGPRTLEVVASACRLWCANGCNNFPTMLGPAVHRGKDTTPKSL